jgi:hypothetical protein
MAAIAESTATNTEKFFNADTSEARQSAELIYPYDTQFSAESQAL